MCVFCVQKVEKGKEKNIKRMRLVFSLSIYIYISKYLYVVYIVYMANLGIM